MTRSKACRQSVRGEDKGTRSRAEKDPIKAWSQKRIRQDRDYHIERPFYAPRPFSLHSQFARPTSSMVFFGHYFVRPAADQSFRKARLNNGQGSFHGRGAPLERSD